MLTREARRGLGPRLVSAPREAQGCLVIQQVAAFQLWSHTLAKPASKPAAAVCACCGRRQLRGNLQEILLPVAANFPYLAFSLWLEAMVFWVSSLPLLNYVAYFLISPVL